MYYIENPWFVDDHGKLVCHKKNGLENRFIIYEMRRMARQVIKGARGNYWTFDNSRVIVDESKFEWDSPGLRGTLQKNVKTCQQDPAEAKSMCLRTH